MIGSLLGAAAAAAGAASLLVAADRVAALGAAVTGAVVATDPAVRLGITGKLTFPVDTDPSFGPLVCLNNFGGYSASSGACNHNGIDIGNSSASGKGRPLLACVDGFVEKDETFNAAGRTRILRDGLGTFYRYHHLDRYETSLQAGDAVAAGQVIGYMGSSGNTSWDHLHFEVWLNSLTPRLATIVDPVPRLPFPVPGVTLNTPTAC